MKLVLAVCLFTAMVQASLTIHIQSPWRSDAAKSSYVLHILGGTTGYNADYSASSVTKMTSEGSGWFSYTWDKNVSDFQDWQTFTVSAYPDSSDQNYNNNNGVAWKDSSGNALAFKMSATFGTDSEIWLYTNSDGTYTKSFVAPGSKIVWFKSPWGNRALPRMIFGTDTTLMRFAFDDSTYCGWFYGAITPAKLAANPLKEAFFERYNAAYLTFPAEGTVDLSSALSSADTVFVDGTSAATVGLKIGSVGECFDSSRTIHVYSPYRNNSTYKDSLLFMSVGNNILNNPNAMDSVGEFKHWFRMDFSAATASKSEWTSSGAKVQLYRRQSEWPQVVFFQSEQPLISDFFPTGVYESWLFTNSNGSFEISFAPLEQKIVRLLSPWDNMAPSMLLNGDTVRMGPFSSDTCGWYEGAYYKHFSPFSASFKQTFGFEVYGAEGLGEAVEITMDSVLSASDTVWVTPYPTLSSAPRLYSSYPGRLGICPSLKISAMVVDWAGEAFPDSVDVDFGGTYDGNAYTTVTYIDSTGELKTNSKCQGLVQGMVQDTLVNGAPARVDSLDFPWDKCGAAHEIEKWFVPVVVATDDAGKDWTNATCRDIDLTLDAEGFWLADISESHEDGGFFPIDDFKYLDSAGTIPNPKFDWKESLSTPNGKHHNYSFAMKISAQFQYVRGQYFEFRGDDDVWVFINNKLVVDIGGIHSAVEDAVDLDTLGLTEGETYPFHIFFSERNATGSNFKMRTSINLETEKTYYPKEIKTTDGTISYEVWQMLIDKSLSCDVSSVSKVDTVPAASLFLLKGGNLDADGVTLEPGLNYGGILINETMAGFTIDTSAIVRSRTLAPGSYVLYFYLASDQTQSSKVSFTVPEYPQPTIVFTDSLWNEIDPDTVSLGTWAFIPYTVYVAVYYMNAPCDSGCDGTLEFMTSDSLAFSDLNGNLISSIKTSGGKASFNVAGTAKVEKGSFKVFGSAFDNTLEWKNISLEEPPVPIPAGGKIFDRDGDGVADSLILAYAGPITGEDTPDTVAWSFGDSTWYKLWRSDVEAARSKDSLLVLVKDSLLPTLFTGSSEQAAFVGSYETWYNKPVEDSVTGEIDTVQWHLTGGKILDKIGPVLTSAIVTPQNESVYKLSLVFSEAIDTNSFSLDSVFEFRAWRSGAESSHGIAVASGKKNVTRYEIFYSNKNGVLPSVGDSVRLTPGLLTDYSGNAASEKNRWVRIVGEQYIRIESAQVFDSKISNEKDSSKVLNRVPLDYSYEKAEKSVGLPGFLIHYDLNELILASGAEKEDVYLNYEMNFFTNLGAFVRKSKGTVRCTDDIFGGDCTTHTGNLYLAWNMRDKNDRRAGTGAYVATLKIKVGTKTSSQKKDVTRTWGIRRVKE